jgi:peptide/nickel transport system substrate-binding protein
MTRTTTTYIVFLWGIVTTGIGAWSVYVVAAVTTNGDYETTFHLKRPQPSLLALLATGWSPVYPCHVSPREMRKHPIGTGPFKFVDFKPNQSITVVRNPDYWKPGRPYLDGIEYTIIKDVSTRLLSFCPAKTTRILGSRSRN